MMCGVCVLVSIGWHMCDRNVQYLLLLAFWNAYSFKLIASEQYVNCEFKHTPHGHLKVSNSNNSSAEKATNRSVVIVISSGVPIVWLKQKRKSIGSCAKRDYPFHCSFDFIRSGNAASDNNNDWKARMGYSKLQRENIFASDVSHICIKCYYWFAIPQQTTCVVSVNPTKSAHCTLFLFVYCRSQAFIRVEFRQYVQSGEEKVPIPMYTYTQALTLDLMAHDCISYSLVLAARCTLHTDSIYPNCIFAAYTIGMRSI